MAKFTVSDVMDRKVDGVSTGYAIVIECEGSGGVKVSNSIFISNKELPLASASSIAAFAEGWLKTKDGETTRAEAMAQKAVSVSDEQVKTLIPSNALIVDVKTIEP
jgi:hypothetical protein